MNQEKELKIARTRQLNGGMKEDPRYSDPNAVSVLKVRQWMNELSNQSAQGARRPDMNIHVGQSHQIGFGNV